MPSDVKEFEFRNFDNQVIKSDDDVKGYSFEEFKDGVVYEPAKKQEELKIERDFAFENNFSLSPIVKEYRGHSEQERIEKERRIEHEVRKRVDALKEEAFQEGYQEGINQGREEVFKQTRAETEEKMSALVEMINEVLCLKDEVLTHQKSEISNMIKVLTKWVILRELKDDETYIERLLEKLITEMQTKSNLLIQVNQNAFEKMPDVLEHIEKKMGELKNVRVEIDYDIKDQGIVLESDNGIVNGTLEEQLNSLSKLFESIGASGE